MVVWTAAGSVAFTALLVWLAGAIFQRQLETRTGQAFETLAAQTADKLDRDLQARVQFLQFAARANPLRFSPGNATLLRQWIEDILDASPDFGWTGFADTNGAIVCGSHGLLENTRADNRPWFLAGREGPHVGRVHDLPELAREIRLPEEDGPTRFVDISVPVRDNDGRLQGVLVAMVRWSWARDVQRSVVPDSARRDRIGVTIYDLTGEVLLDSGGTDWNQPPVAPSLPERRGVRGSLREATGLGTTFLSGYARSQGFRDFYGLGWLVVVRQPLAQVLSPVRELRRTIGRWGFVLCTVSAAAAWIFAGRLARPLNIIGRAARRIREGDILTVLPRPRGDGELARMCGELGDMVDDFRAKQENGKREPSRPPPA